MLDDWTVVHALSGVVLGLFTNSIPVSILLVLAWEGLEYIGYYQNWSWGEKDWWAYESDENIGMDIVVGTAGALLAILLRKVISAE